MLVGVLSDTHIPKVGKRLPADALEKLAGVDLILHAGDLVCLEALAQLERIAPVEAVCGNMDWPEVRACLPESRVLDLEGLKVGLAHGSGAPLGIEKRVLRQFERVDVVIFGHTHKAMIEEKGGVLLLNPGSPNDTRFHPRRSLILLEIREGVPFPEIVYL